MLDAKYISHIISMVQVTIEKPPGHDMSRWKKKKNIKDPYTDSFKSDRALGNAQTFPPSWEQPVPRTSWLLIETTVFFLSLSLSSPPNEQPSPSWVPSAMPGMKTHCTTTDRAQEREFNQLPPKHRAAIHGCQQTGLCGIWTVLTSSFFNEFFKGICVPKMSILETRNRAPK